MSDLISNPNQERAVMHADGAAQVFAGPGSGKTYVTVQRIRHLITERGVDPSHILVITFTKAAALEMQERFFRLMAPERPPVRFATFHALFYHILKQSAQYRGYSIISESEKKKLIRQITHMHKRFLPLQEEDLEEIIASVSAYRRTAEIGKISLQKTTAEDIRFLADAYEGYLREWKQMDFDDIAPLCKGLLMGHTETLLLWRRNFPYILIDEFQDISPEQYEIVRLLAAPRNNLFIVGDDDQSIYGFRGASPDSMQEYMRDYPDAARIFLDVNYRCNRQIVDASLRVIGENKNRVAKRIRAAHGEGEGFHCEIFKDEAEEQEALVKNLSKKREEGTLGKCALLCRTNYDCAVWAQNLHKRNIPFIMRGPAQNRFEHFVIRDIMAYLALACGELERKHFLRVMNRPVRYIRRDSVLEERVSESGLLRHYREAPAVQAQIRKLFGDLGSLKGRRPHLQIHFIRRVIGYDNYLREKYGADKAEELIGRAVEFQRFAEEFRTFGELRDYISQYGETLQRQRDTAFRKEEAQPEEGIWIVTMHASKGLEFDAVYVPGCQEGKIPSATARTEEALEEERRMFYVAMTRARYGLWVTAHQGQTGKDIPSRFLQCLSQSSPPTSSSNSAASRYSSKASATASYSSSSSM